MTRKTELILSRNDITKVLAEVYHVDPDNVRIQIHEYYIQETITLEEEEEE